MTTRDEDAREFAAVMGWILGTDDGEPMFFDADMQSMASFPAPDAPLHEHLAFVGRVAEALGDFDSIGRYSTREGGGVEWGVSLDGRDEDVASDPSHAALRAAVAAKRKP